MENLKNIVINGVTYIPENLAKKVEKDGLTYCIIRSKDSGVWAGWVDYDKVSENMKIYEGRRLWRWWADFTLSSLALEGYLESKKHENKYSKITPEGWVLGICEVFPCSPEASEKIQNLPYYSENNG